MLRHLTLEQARTLADELRLAVKDLTNRPRPPSASASRARSPPASRPRRPSGGPTWPYSARAKSAGGNQVWVADMDDDPDTGHPVVTADRAARPALAGGWLQVSYPRTFVNAADREFRTPSELCGLRVL